MLDSSDSFAVCWAWCRAGWWSHKTANVVLRFGDGDQYVEGFGGVVVMGCSFGACGAKGDGFELQRQVVFVFVTLVIFCTVSCM